MILLSFDTEEFDVPREHGVDFTLEQGMAVSMLLAHGHEFITYTEFVEKVKK